MKKYLVTIKSDFVGIPGESHEDLHGFFATFEIAATGADAAVREAISQHEQAIEVRGIHLRSSGLFKTRFVVDEVWEPVEDASQPSFVSGGFVFYRITRLASFFSLIKFVLARSARAGRVFSLPVRQERAK